MISEKKRWRMGLLIRSSVCCCLFLSAQAFGLLDEIDGRVFSIALQADNKVIIGGTFNEVNGDSHNDIARLNPDGSLDPTFNLGEGTNGIIYELALQPDGKVLIAGKFSEVNGISRNGIARLNVDGSLDSTFSPYFGENNTISALILQPDGKILTGGIWTDPTAMSFPTRGRILRFNADGSVDSTFGSTITNRVKAVVLQPDGKVIVGGSSLARLNSNGSVDPTFNAPQNVESLALQPDGKILVGKPFSGGLSDLLVRLNADGSYDSTFSLSDGAGETSVDAISVLPSGKILFASRRVIEDDIDDGRTPSLARLNIDGSLDSTFNIVFATGNASEIYEIVLQQNNKILVGGIFNRLNGVYTPGVARLNANGTISLPLDDAETCLPIKALNGNIAVVCL